MHITQGHKTSIWVEFKDQNQTKTAIGSIVLRYWTPHPTWVTSEKQGLAYIYPYKNLSRMGIEPGSAEDCWNLHEFIRPLSHPSWIISGELHHD